MFIGCGGWAYWQVDRPFQTTSDKLADYATVFNFVEINNTFYNIPSIKDVKSWRARVPNDFQFAVKCSRKISHDNPLVSIESNFQAMEQMFQICGVLNAVALIIQTPPRFIPTAQNLIFADTFFAHYADAPIALVWEPRGARWTDPPKKAAFKRILTNYNLTHCIDITKEKPLHSAEISYTRIFGKGRKNQWQFDDAEIQELHNRASDLPKTTYVTFHTQRQTHDAARMKAFDETGRLVSVSGAYGVNSVMLAVDEYQKYPITKQELLDAHGWKIIDISENRRVRANKLLRNLPDTEFPTRKKLKISVERLFRGMGQKNMDEVLME
ncbi:MAG: DUF72 domain-containing protein [Candidatus Helarchaeota archaeon]